MKKQILIAAAMISFAQTQAQTPAETQKSLRLKTYRSMVNNLLKQQEYNGQIAAKPTDIQHRVKSQVLISDFSLKDSTVFKYSGTRNSTFNYDSDGFAYNNYFEPYYTLLPPIPYINNPSDLQADSIIVYKDNILNSKINATYRTDNKLIKSNTTQFPAGTAPEYGTFSLYNSGGHMIATYNIYDNDTTDKRTITYNAAFTQVLVDSFFEKDGSNYELSTVTRYAYNNQNKVDSILVSESTGPGQFEAIDNIIFDYYPDGKMREMTYYYLGEGSDNFPNIDSFGYTAGIAYTTLWDVRSTFIIEEDTINYWERTIKYPGSNGLPDSVKNFNFDEQSSSWIEYENAVYTYTAFNAPETISFYESGEQFGLNRFYYEEYDDGISSVRSIAESKEFMVYPNPFAHNFSIEWKSALPNEKVTVKLVNIIGQEVLNISMKQHPGKNEITLPAINAGTYVLIIQTADGKTWSQKMIKQ